MYLNAMEFLDEEREAWRPFEALAEVPDDRLDLPVEGAHGWSARDLIGHLVAWQEWALAVAKDLAVSETSATLARMDAEWEARGDAMNDDIQAEWRALPVDEVRRRLTTIPGELRGYLTVVPERRWVKHDTHLRSFIDETIDHYADHASDLEAILASAHE
ncbi:MAG TPA: maleylpyruvate isomerase N-terminal domain-containing protein [Candidatus Limnocylindrales bacterium]|nr:maleylpyruvate isomerase N-terminal domain-containing protein [Candidatus Limnocylindrales bacterium]